MTNCRIGVKEQTHQIHSQSTTKQNIHIKFPSSSSCQICIRSQSMILSVKLRQKKRKKSETEQRQRISGTKQVKIN